MSNRLRISVRILPNGRPKEVIGRDAWALLNPRAGEPGCTPIDTSGPRVEPLCLETPTHRLRHRDRRGISGGTFAGLHARDILRSEVELVERRGLAE